MRSCTGLADNVACDGSAGHGSGVITQSFTGGVGVISDSELNLSDGSTATGTVTFGSGALPIIKASAASTAAGSTRINTNNLGFQAFTYNGATASPLSFQAVLNVDDAGINNTGNLAGGSLFTAYVAIWDPSALAGANSAQDLFNDLFYAPCSHPGVLAFGNIGGSLAPGAQTETLTTTACGGGTFTIQPGQTVLAVAALQFPVNRGGFVDATHTFTVNLDPALPPQTLSNLQSNLAPAAVANIGVPTLTEWMGYAFALLMALTGAAVLTRRMIRR